MATITLLWNSYRCRWVFVFICALFSYTKPTHLNFNIHEKCWAINSGAMQIKHKYLVSFRTPFTRKTGEDKVLDETLLLMKWQSVQSLGWSLGVDESSPAQLAEGTPLDSICQTITVQQLLWECTDNSHLPFLSVAVISLASQPRRQTCSFS